MAPRTAHRSARVQGRARAKVPRSRCGQWPHRKTTLHSDDISRHSQIMADALRSELVADHAESGGPVLFIYLPKDTGAAAG